MTAPPAAPRPLLVPILAAGFAAGVLDIAAALGQTTLRGGSPQRLLQAIASGWLGRASYDGGWLTAALGLASHFMIATGAATVFVLAARRIPFLFRAPWVSGPIYGLCVWAMMRFVIVPLSAFPHAQGGDLRGIATAWLIHVTCVGLPIAFAARAATRTADIRVDAA